MAASLSENDDFAALGTQKSHDQVQEHALAATVGTDEADMLARVELTVQVLKSGVGGRGVQK